VAAGAPLLLALQSRPIPPPFPCSSLFSPTQSRRRSSAGARISSPPPLLFFPIPPPFPCSSLFGSSRSHRGGQRSHGRAGLCAPTAPSCVALRGHRAAPSASTRGCRSYGRVEGRRPPPSPSAPRPAGLRRPPPSRDDEDPAASAGRRPPAPPLREWVAADSAGSGHSPMGRLRRRAGPARKIGYRAVPGLPARHDARHGPARNINRAA
jgi:hypothetical protein